MELMQISGKMLGSLALKGSCERCFWIGVRCKHLPFQFFPGIFSSIDSYTKKVLHGHFDRRGEFPKWLSPLGELKGYMEPPGFKRFNLTDEETNIKLTGAADGILKCPDGSIMIVDYKTARFTEGQDERLPEYEVQLNAYRLIAEAIGLGRVSGLHLIYFEPATDEDDAVHVDAMADGGFRLTFKPKFHRVEINPQMVKNLLKRARAIGDLKKPPAAENDCRNCQSLRVVISHLDSTP